MYNIYHSSAATRSRGGLRTKKKTVSPWLLAGFALSVVIGGLNALGVHYTVLELPPFWSAALRIGPAALIMFSLVFIMKLPLPRGRALLGAVLFGVLNFGGNFAFIYIGFEKIKPGMSMVILALVPLFTLLLSLLHRQELFRWQALLGSLVALSGIVLVFQQQLGAEVPILSLLSMILGAVCFAEAGVVAKHFTASHPITTNAVGMSAGALFLILMSLLWREHWSLPVQPSTWIALGYLVLFGTCAMFLIFLNLLKHWQASTLAYQFVLFPFVALAASAWLTGEALSPMLAAGAALVLAGVLVGILSPAKKTAAAGSLPRGSREAVPSKIIK
jgi:drug/metabolite transporter (DMT)-like permease